VKHRNTRAILAVLILAITVTAFVYYFIHNPSVKQQLSTVSPMVLALVMLLYFCMFGSLSLINDSTVKLCKVRLGKHQNILLTSYTAVINFFGPLQSGPAFRAVYLKKKYKINLKTYAFASLIYYFLFAAYSGVFLLSGLLKYWLIPLAVLGLLVAYLASRNKILKPKLAKLDLPNIYYLAGATFLQVCITVLIYFTELKSVSPSITFGQAVIYTGAANFALFVSITPGAIGFREAFLVFSQRLHHISNSTIVAANVLDRAVYIVVLLMLALFILITHAKQQLISDTNNLD